MINIKRVAFTGFNIHIRLAKPILRLLGISTVLLVLSMPASAQQCTGGVCPPIIVTAPATSGPQILCQGSSCGDMLRNMQAQLFWNLDQTDQQLIDEEQMRVPRNQFCSGLKASKPPGCASTPPPVPMVNTSVSAYANSYGNGCGDGSWSAIFGNYIAQAALTGYTGDPDRPLLGVNFRPACNMHDACYAGQGVRGTCDDQLHSALMGICAGTGTAASACNGYAHAYGAAVSLGGQSAYTASYQLQRCALWHKNMEGNGCPK